MKGERYLQGETAAERRKSEQAERLEQYKLMVEMADRVSQRRQAANSFYLSINTILVGGSAYFGGGSPPLKTALLVSLAGVLVCRYWSRSILSYKTLNTAKFAVINDIELHLTERPFTDEWAKLDPDGDGKKHNSFYETEKFVPRVFVGVYVFQAATAIPWQSIWHRLLALAC
ncbi:hypothetical protein [Sphingobium sp.]|uniref:RipA family octameric membrane protein n=1 Tax=Sphingobium sp. TaxID=1912891 RepID=UPI0028BF3B3E|nr:hypothetical protein [Sphingobium sp.]